MITAQEQERIWSDMERRSRESARNARYRKEYPKARPPTDAMRERYHYDKVTEMLFEMLGDHTYRMAEFREKVRQLRDKHRRAFREYLEYVFNDDDHVGFTKIRARKSSREISFSPRRYRQCDRCGRLFYDLSRNGRTKYCHYIIGERWVSRQNEVVRLFNEDSGRYTSVCERERDNANSRRSFNRSEYGTEYDGFKEYTESTRERKERELFVVYNPLARGKKAQEALWALEGQMSDYTGEFRDPQDVVCRTPTTCRPHRQPKSPQRFHLPATYNQRKLAAYYEPVRWVYSVNITTGEREVHDGELYDKFFGYRSE